MKLFLTSNWICNNSIKQALSDLVGKKFEDMNIAFVPTAANNEYWDKTWLVDDLNNVRKLNPKCIHLIDIQAVDKDFFMKSFTESDVIIFGWWDPYHLMRHIEKSDLWSKITQLFENKVYVWISAWSMITSPDLNVKLSYHLYYNDDRETEAIAGINFVDFYCIPHLNSPDFPKTREKNILKASKETPRCIYAIDDESAIKIDWDKTEIISEWEYLVFNDQKLNR